MFKVTVYRTGSLPLEYVFHTMKAASEACSGYKEMGYRAEITQS